MEGKVLKNLILRFNGLTDAQVIALVRMGQYMERFGQVGHSGYISFMADGDGNFRPDFSYSIENAPGVDFLNKVIASKDVLKSDVNLEKQYKESGDLKIDFDSYAWELHD